MTHWTWPAWTDSHKDFFTRNIVTTAGAAAAGELAERNNFRSNAQGVEWPTFEDVKTWMASEGIISNDVSNAGALQWATSAAVNRVSERTGLQVHPVADDGTVLVDQLERIPHEVHLATVMQAAKWYRRRASPDGTLGANAFGATVRAGRFDSDVEALLGNYLRYGIA